MGTAVRNDMIAIPTKAKAAAPVKTAQPAPPDGTHFRNALAEASRQSDPPRDFAPSPESAGDETPVDATIDTESEDSPVDAQNPPTESEGDSPAPELLVELPLDAPQLAPARFDPHVDEDDVPADAENPADPLPDGESTLPGGIARQSRSTPPLRHLVEPVTSDESQAAEELPVDSASPTHFPDMAIVDRPARPKQPVSNAPAKGGETVKADLPAAVASLFAPDQADGAPDASVEAGDADEPAIAPLKLVTDDTTDLADSAGKPAAHPPLEGAPRDALPAAAPSVRTELDLQPHGGKPAPAQLHAAPTQPEIEFVASNHGRIVTAVRSELLPGGGTMQIRLNPPELGVLQISVRMQDGVMSASFQTSSDDATRLLSHSLSHLKSALESQGVSVERLQVEQSPRQQRPSDDRPSQQQDPRQQDQSFARNEQQRRELLQRMWRRMSMGDDPLDMVA